MTGTTATTETTTITDTTVTTPTMTMTHTTATTVTTTMTETTFTITTTTEPISFRLKGRRGGEEVRITVGDETSTHKLTNNFQTFTYPWPDKEFYTVHFLND